MILVLPYKDGLFFFLLSIQLCMLTFCQLFTKVEVEVSHSKTVLELEIWPFLFFCISSLESPTVQRLAVKSAIFKTGAGLLQTVHLAVRSSPWNPIRKNLWLLGTFIGDHPG